MEARSLSQRFPSALVPILNAAGWYEGRQSPERTRSDGVSSPFAAASAILTEFGGLYFHAQGPGLNMAKSNVGIDASLTPGLSEDLREFSSNVGQQLYPIGELDHGHANLIVDEGGLVYMLTNELTLMAPDFDQSLGVFLLGSRLNLAASRAE